MSPNISKEVLHNGFCVWVTGLSNSGKTTLASNLAAKIKKINRNPIFLDGDALRDIFGDRRYDLSSRKKIAYQYAGLCKLLTSQGFIVIIATISLFHEIHEWNRKNIGGYFEIFLDTSMEELIKRDTRNIYKLPGDILNKNVSGADLHAEFPIAPDLHIKDNSIEVEHIVEILNDKFFLKIQEGLS